MISIKSISNKPPRYFACIYLLAIPFFAIVFMFLNRGFYSNTIKIERSYSKEANFILSNACSHLINQAEKLGRLENNGKYSGESLRFSFLGQNSSGIPIFRPRPESSGERIGDVTCGENLRIDDNGAIVFPLFAGFSMYSEALGEGCGRHDGGKIAFLVKIHTGSSSFGGYDSIKFRPQRAVDFTKDENGQKYFILHVEYSVVHDGYYPDFIGKYDAETEDRLIRYISNAIFSHGYSGKNGYTIDITQEFQDRIGRFIDSTTGFTSDISIWDNFFRMLYLSAATITTLGYGDIVPISELARLFVSIESVLGVVLAGFYFNSLALKIANR